MMLYNHLATTKLPIAHAQIAMPNATVVNRDGTRTRSAAPIQNREKKRALAKEKIMVETTKVVKRRMGVSAKDSCTATKLCTD